MADESTSDGLQAATSANDDVASMSWAIPAYVDGEVDPTQPAIGEHLSSPSNTAKNTEKEQSNLDLNFMQNIMDLMTQMDKERKIHFQELENIVQQQYNKTIVEMNDIESKILSLNNSQVEQERIDDEEYEVGKENIDLESEIIEDKVSEQSENFTNGTSETAVNFSENKSLLLNNKTCNTGDIQVELHAKINSISTSVSKEPKDGDYNAMIDYVPCFDGHFSFILHHVFTKHSIMLNKMCNMSWNAWIVHSNDHLQNKFVILHTSRSDKCMDLESFLRQRLSRDLGSETQKVSNCSITCGYFNKREDTFNKTNFSSILIQHEFNHMLTNSSDPVTSDFEVNNEKFEISRRRQAHRVALVTDSTIAAVDNQSCNFEKSLEESKTSWSKKFSKSSSTFFVHVASSFNFKKKISKSTTFQATWISRLLCLAASLAPSGNCRKPSRSDVNFAPRPVIQTRIPISYKDQKSSNFASYRTLLSNYEVFINNIMDTALKEGNSDEQQRKSVSLDLMLKLLQTTATDVIECPSMEPQFI